MIKMANPNYVCTACSQTFTRKWRGKIHKRDIHEEGSQIVSMIDYIVGRTSGRYLPSDPALFRRKKGSKNRLGNHTEDRKSASGVASDNLSRSNEHAVNEDKGVLNKNHYGREHFSYFMDTGSPSSISTQQSNGSSSPYPIEETQEATIKLAEIKKLASKYRSPREVKDLLSEIMQACLVRGNNNTIDMALDSLRKAIAYKEAEAY
jgi:hypothetical protein